MGRKIQLQYKWQMTEKVRLFLFLNFFFILIFFYKHYKICIEASLINIVFGKGPIFSLSLSPFFSLLMKLCQAKKKKKKTLPGLEHSQVVWVMESSTEKKEEEKGKKNALMILCQDGYYNSFSAKPALKKKSTLFDKDLNVHIELVNRNRDHCLTVSWKVSRLVNTVTKRFCLVDVYIICSDWVKNDYIGFTGRLLSVLFSVK